VASKGVTLISASMPTTSWFRSKNIDTQGQHGDHISQFSFLNGEKQKKNQQGMGIPSINDHFLTT
jgi:hypothetical protein